MEEWIEAEFKVYTSVDLDCDEHMAVKVNPNDAGNLALIFQMSQAVSRFSITINQKPVDCSNMQWINMPKLFKEEVKGQSNG